MSEQNSHEPDVYDDASGSWLSSFLTLEELEGEAAVDQAGGELDGKDE